VCVRGRTKKIGFFHHRDVLFPRCRLDADVLRRTRGECPGYEVPSRPRWRPCHARREGLHTAA
jgi:hypothetical protein